MEQGPRPGQPRLNEESAAAYLIAAMPKRPHNTEQWPPIALNLSVKSLAGVDKEGGSEFLVLAEAMPARLTMRKGLLENVSESVYSYLGNILQIHQNRISIRSNQIPIPPCQLAQRHRPRLVALHNSVPAHPRPPRGIPRPCPQTSPPPSRNTPAPFPGHPRGGRLYP